MKTWFASIVSGGSFASWSAACAAKTVVVQLSPGAKSAFGLTVNTVGPPLTAVSATLRVPLVAQTIWNQLPLTFTGSLNVTVTFALRTTPVAPFAGPVVETDGAASMVKLKTWSASGVSGGSPASWSLTCAATIVTVQVSPGVKSVSGLSVNVVVPPVTRSRVRATARRARDREPVAVSR